jgi:uncharacterized membrane protein
MSNRRMLGIGLFVVAVIAAVVGVFLMSGGHNKSGIGLIVAGVILIIGGLVSFFSRASAAGEKLDSDMFLPR